MSKLLKSRRAGVILHLTSLPGPQACGSLGQDAYRWLDWLHTSGFRVWQFLPLTPVADGSPYNSYSAFAGNPRLIDIAAMKELGFPDRPELRPDATDYVLQALQHQFDWFEEKGPKVLKQQLEAFADSQSWLEDYCLFAALKEIYPCHWVDWPKPLRDRDENAIAEFSRQYSTRIDFQRFVQFIFFTQLQAVKRYANSRDIVLFGDMPIFVSHDSVDVWSHRHLFKLDAQGHPQVVAGVPPDYFSASGQRWGNPLYDWNRHSAEHFTWWQSRINHSLSIYDAIRIDHFRGFVACWEIPSHEPTAINGHWVEAPGVELFNALLQSRNDLPLIAEDLGIITEEVIALRKRFKLPGMKILQFAFDSDALNPYLPHNHSKDSIIYTGTHDNNTSLGWFQGLNAEQKKRVLNYYSWPGEPMPWPLIKSALASVGSWAIMPMQDLLIQGAEHRMNTPGTTEGNWRWRFEWHQVQENLAPYLNSLNRMYRRC